jgi:very-short-patch-repair endonuclease/predicted transcriptional regulator of viral defense system
MGTHTPGRGEKTKNTFAISPSLVWPQVLALALAQHGIVALYQLVALGLDARAIQARAAAGQLHRIHHAVYSLIPRKLLSREGRFMAAVLACGPEAALSHRSAAAFLGLRPTSRANVDVTVPTESHRRHAGIDLHRSTTLTRNDVTTVNNIPCTTTARTLLDLGDVIYPRQHERAFDQAEAMGVLNMRAIKDQLERNRTRRAARRTRAVVEDHYIGETITLSEFEEAMIPLLRAAELPMPRINEWIILDDGEPAILADFCWPDKRVIGETDGWTTHRTRQAFERDRRRDQRLAAAGWHVIRITWWQLRREPQRVIATIAAVLKA